MDQDEIKKKIDELVTSIGATGELLGALRITLINNGFARDEAVYMCAQVLIGMTTGNKGGER